MVRSFGGNPKLHLPIWPRGVNNIPRPHAPSKFPLTPFCCLG